MRDLRADEIEVRIAMIKETGVQLLLYKTARTDMQILDETFGPTNWKNSYREVKGNLYCTISVWDEEKKQWIDKEDCGVESNTEKEKGEASDSFKRAGTRWGIGRELYTPIFIWIKAEDSELEKKNGKTICKAKFEVEKIRIEDKIITGLSIINSRTKRRVFGYDAK